MEWLSLIETENFDNFILIFFRKYIVQLRDIGDLEENKLISCFYSYTILIMEVVPSGA